MATTIQLSQKMVEAIRMSLRIGWTRRSSDTGVRMSSMDCDALESAGSDPMPWRPTCRLRWGMAAAMCGAGGEGCQSGSMKKATASARSFHRQVPCAAVMCSMQAATRSRGRRRSS